LKEYLNLRPSYGRLLEFKKSKLRFLKNVRSMLKISYANCLGLSPAILLQFSVEMCAASKNCEKFTKNPLGGGFQGHLKS